MNKHQTNKRMKPQIIQGLINQINAFISANPDFSLSSVCQLAGWNSSSYGRAIKSRNIEAVKGSKSNPMAKLYELIEANDFDGARDFLEVIMDFRAECNEIVNAQTEAAETKATGVEATGVEATEVEATEVEATEVEATEAEATEAEVSRIQDFVHHLEEEMQAIENPTKSEFDSDFDSLIEIDEDDEEVEWEDNLDNLD